MEADELVGSLVDGRYTVLAPMASGSMGAVYKAERVPVGKTVAIKFLHASFANDSEFLARFERETQVMSKLAHPNCVSVVDFGVWNGSPYLVMEYVGGRTLRTMLDDDGPIAPARALGLARQIAAGLAHAHAQGITHRDVKPANLMISEEIGTGEHVRILDFGLARLRGAVGRDATQINVVVGTPNYMAPEQTIGGGIIDARTDVYACGVVLFEMIAGERPFQAEDTLALLGMHRAAPIPRLSDRTDVELPRGLQEVVEKAMAKSPDDRYPSAIALAEAIDAIIGGRSTAEIKPVIGARKLDSAAIAPTMVDIGSGSAPVASSMHIQAPSRGGGGKAISLLLLLVLGGGAYGAYYLKNRADRKDASATAGSDLPVGSARSEIGSGSGSAIPAGSGSAELVAPADADLMAGSGAPAVEDAGTAVEDAGTEVALAASGSGSADPGAGSGSGSAGGDEIDMAPDPVEATNPAGDTDDDDASDEAADAPKTPEDIEKRAPPQPVLATTISESVQLIQQGKRELALASLRALYKKSPKSAYIPFLLGNLYFDQRWWSVALEHYKAAISRNAGYRRNATLNRNVIRMLVSNKTARAAERFLRGTIGFPARAYLLHAAKHEKNAYLRSQAARIGRTIR